MTARRVTTLMSVAAALWSTPLAMPAGATDAPERRREVMANLATEVIEPAYRDLARATETTVEALDLLCAQPSTEQLVVARRAWQRSWRAWNRTRAFRFGPVMDQRLAADIAFTIDVDKLDDVLAGDDPRIAPPFTLETVGAVGADVRGLGAIEHILFFVGVPAPERCSYAVSAAELVAAATAEATDAWSDGTGAELASGTGAYDDPQVAVDALVNGLSMALVEATRELADAQVTDDGIPRTVGAHAGARIRDTLWSVRAVYTGRAGPGIDALIAAASSDTKQRVDALLTRTTRVVGRLPVDLADTPDRLLDSAYLRARSLGTIVRAEIASALGVTLSLGDSDGDS
jgi:predicted lipoprotein